MFISTKHTYNVYEFIIHAYKSNDEMTNYITKKFQTLTYFGFNKFFFEKYIENNKPLGIDKIVPIGKGLNIDLFWDGYDVIKTLSREVHFE